MRGKAFDVGQPSRRTHIAAQAIHDLSEVNGKRLSYAHSYIIAQWLAENWLLVMDPQIIRTAKELEALDPDTQLMMKSGSDNVIMSASTWMGDYELSPEGILPLVVLVPGSYLREAGKALGDD
ncbi:hypothetical protein [Corynebacterium stationis]|uniref:hypothetical protein n=1 Tax=Corynebacterium stationis TaxID=1705 RepID=UPI00076F69B0|nr:hypothetical protein [Corynebacterium stationis]AMJ43670.1 hypothetical protein AW169_01150 [Corynebacterium stationis]AQX70117.1 hypothetical protein CA21670_00275 [Corynebacterium stationis]ASJ17821.1 hypothetical protein BA700_01150 [Corynebacterium stationis]HJG64013.1 hypothetical protein [Corynebacterium stationis]